MKKKANVLSVYEFFKLFPNSEKALKYFEKIRWKNKPVCPYCESRKISKRKFPYYRCKVCVNDFTVRTASIFERSKIPMHKWLFTIYLLNTARKGISSLQLSKEIKVTQKTAWSMLHRLREACKEKKGTLSGIVSVDETFFGGLRENKHKSKIDKNKSWREEKTMVQGLRAGNQVKTKVVNTTSKEVLQGNIIENVEAGSKIVTDEAMHYHTLDKRFDHTSLHHATNQYVKNGLSTNGIESVWALIKRGYKGVYHHWSKKHLPRYLNEFTFRLDQGNCENDTIDRVNSLLKNSVKKRLTYKELTE